MLKKEILFIGFEIIGIIAIFIITVFTIPADLLVYRYVIRGYIPLREEIIFIGITIYTLFLLYIAPENENDSNNKDE